MRDLIAIVGWRNIDKGVAEGLILTGYIAAVYLGVCAVIPFI